MSSGELLGEVCRPSELVIPAKLTGPAVSGSIILSGSKLCFYSNGEYKQITSA